MNEEGTLIINSDNDMLRTVKNIKQKIITFGFENEADIFAYNIKIENGYTMFNIKENSEEYLVKLKLIGEKFIYNALAAWTIGKIYEIPIKDRIDALEKCEFTKMRMNIEKINNLIIIDDCYNASPESMKLGLQALANQESKRKISILGDMFELGEYAESLHTKVGEDVAEFKIDKLITVGELAKNICKGAENKGMTDFIHFETVDELLEKIEGYICEEDAILVKASRGMKFERIIEKIKNI